MYHVYCERPTTGQVWEMVALGEVRVVKSTNEPGSLSATFLRDEMTVENQDVVAVVLDERGNDDANLFYGYVEETDKCDDEVQVTAHDQLMVLKGSEDIKVYGDKKASEIYNQMIEEHNLYKLDPPNILDTEHVIPEVINDGKKPLDLMTEALNITYEATGKTFYMYDFFRNLCIGESELHKIPMEEYELNGDNIKYQGYHYKQSRSEWVNQVAIRSDDEKNELLAIRQDTEDILKRGVIGITRKIKDGENPDAVADQLFNSKRVEVTSLTVDVYGVNPQLYPARNVHVDFYTPKKEYIKGWFTVESVTYILKDGEGDMTVDLKLYDMEDESWT